MPAREGRLRLDGPPLLLVPEAAQPVGMVLHELATNAVKYGALSRPEGRVNLSWRVLAEPAGGLLVEWRESGGPPLAAPPAQTGFGTRLVQRTVRQLGGEAALDWRADGLRCSFSIPAGKFGAAAATAIAGRPAAPRGRRANPRKRRPRCRRWRRRHASPDAAAAAAARGRFPAPVAWRAAGRRPSSPPAPRRKRPCPTPRRHRHRPPSTPARGSAMST